MLEVVHAREPLPTRVVRSLFLAGPTPRDPAVASWRPEALRLLEERGWAGTVFVPEARSGDVLREYDEQVEWELAALGRADAVVFWVPRDLATLPAFTTNVEFGLFAGSGRAVLGAPPGAPRMSYLRALAARRGVPVFDTLAATLEAASERVGAGAPREGGACQVPLCVFETLTFRSWYEAQRAAGNRLEGARVEWVFRGQAGRPVFCWALHVDVFVAAEGRRKTNEVVLGRPDTAAVVLYHRDDDPLRTEVAIVREFRSAGATADGFVREVPAGSSWDAALSPPEVAVAEVREEAGLSLAPARLRPIGARQVMATLSAHRAHAWAVELTREELDRLRQDRRTHGADDCERTTVEVWTVADLLHRPAVDWATLGMVLAALA